MTVRHSENNYGLRLSGILGKRPDLEAVYVRKLSSTAAADDVTSLREAVLAAHRDGPPSEEAWRDVLHVREDLDASREHLLEAGYTLADLTKLVLDNT
jgi:hypothetical protein